MPKTIARVCQIGTTNYVDYKGERLTVEEYNLKYKRNIRIPKNVKVCESEFVEVSFPTGKYSDTKIKWPNHGSRAKKLPPVYVGDRKYDTVDEMMEIEVPTQRRVEQDNMKEMNRQIEMGWNRGFHLGMVTGAGIVLTWPLFQLLASLIIHSLHH